MQRFLLSTALILSLAAGGGYAYRAVAATSGPGAVPGAAVPQPQDPEAGDTDTSDDDMDSGMLADDQDPGPADFGPPPGPDGGPGHMPGPGWNRGMPHGYPAAFAGGFPSGSPGLRRHDNDKFSLFARVPNKSITAADVKIIATAILLEHGNHSWSVGNVVTGSDKLIDFSYTTAHGDVIATFALDPASGRIKRIS